jgi:hypothetical protein
VARTSIITKTCIPEDKAPCPLRKSPESFGPVGELRLERHYLFGQVLGERAIRFESRVLVLS